ncbi:TIGR03279 family radical SAM protein [Leptolyngbya sp. FACHB-711]|uniref:TIGR03279 family radical SAM protein n=1 Tax=unclassified Leptolyngbya TaxID=2650499 RepID=UPI001689DE6C|nr:TIGR03279 family radical SAM protein [Leptolyngbya sp. FACHB-711]MBD1849063.1 TIGR03279 family radical SAM protein [Cyanobacteria bacterium FACHB-502]MBD2024752.1 TIGR03279 family radical SAM protein [Leptolyngbya sp. FACHB-711]
MSESTLRPALITRVLPESIAAEVGFEPGDRLVAINGQPPRDLIDYQFLCADEVLELEVLDAKGKAHIVEIEKDYDDDLGLEFESALFDGLIQCNNRCPFCFIDQQPPGKRQSLYLKDDDYRLSFLYGSYLTLTNLTSKEWDRIAQMRLSPLFVSVHATEPEVRTRLLKNPRAGQLLDQLRWFQQHRLQIHAQVVVCPGINDGMHLERTLHDLAQFHKGEIPTVASAAIVPVGLTRFRPAEDELVPVTPEKAREVIAQVQPLQAKFRQQIGTTFAWLADEWFLIGREELPPESHYEDYPQLGNGVGSIQQFLKQFQTAARKLPPRVPTPRRYTWIVGNAVEFAFQPIVQRLNQVEGLTIDLVALNSQYWGQQISVTGLITGQDILTALRGRDLGDGILLPAVMLKHDDERFLDDLTVSELSQALNVPILKVGAIEELLVVCTQEQG